jgi:hypothetical protein
VTPQALTVDAGARDLRTADHLLRTLAAGLALPDDVFGCTHLVHGERPRVAVSLTRPGGPLPPGLAERLARRGYAVAPGLPDAAGRAVLSPGAAALTGTLTVAELLARSAIDAVRVLGAAGPAAPRTRLVTRDHVRPQWREGRLELAAVPAAGDTLVPFEVPDPTPCCADH